MCAIYRPEAARRADQSGTSSPAWLHGIGPYQTRMHAERHRLDAHIRDIWTDDDTDVLQGRFTFGLESVLSGLAVRQ